MRLEKGKNFIRYHSLKKEHKKDYNRYKKFKMISYLKAHIEVFPEKREQKKEMYRYLYGDNYALNDNNGLNESHYYVPEAVIVSDIILKEKLIDVKKGLKLIFKNQLSHKFLGILKTEKDIDSLIDELDLAISEGRSWHRIGRFDLENIDNLRAKISYFDVVIRNFCTSYLEIEFSFYFTEEEKERLNKFIRTNYNAKTKTVDLGYIENKKKTGAKLNYLVGAYTDNQEKSELLYDEIEECKFDFLKLMYKYFPLGLFGYGHIPMGIIVNKTNIHYEEEYRDFWESVGIRENGGTFKNKYIKLFPKYELSRQDCNIPTNYILVYNEETLENEYLDLYNGNKLIFIMEDIFKDLHKIYKAIMISNIDEYYNVMCASFRNKINKVSPRKKNYTHLLKIRYLFHLNFGIMEQINEEIDLENVVKNTEKYFADNYLISYDRLKNYKYISTYPIQRFILYANNKKILEERLNEKIVLSGELKQCKEGKKDRVINLITFFISIETFAFLIFPSWAKEVAKMLKVLYCLLSKLL